jgi:type II secretory pathway component PulK
MSKFWLILLEKAIQQLLKADWEAIVVQVMLMMGSTMTGNQKREYVVDAIKRHGYSGATWLLRAAIEVAYGKLKK